MSNPNDLDREAPHPETSAQLLAEIQSLLTNSDRELIVQYMVLRSLRHLGMTTISKSLSAYRQRKPRLARRPKKLRHDG